MADQADRRVALFSIHPRFADAILRGEKRVEFRRRGPGCDTTHVIVYATAPVKRVVGWFQVGFIDEATPSTLWERFGDVGAIGADEYDAYYSGRDTGAAITVAESWALAEPMSLSDLPIDGAAPQSFRYVPCAILDHLCQARAASRGAPTPA